ERESAGKDPGIPRPGPARSLGRIDREAIHLPQEPVLILVPAHIPFQWSAAGTFANARTSDRRIRGRASRDSREWHLETPTLVLYTPSHPPSNHLEILSVSNQFPRRGFFGASAAGLGYFFTAGARSAVRASDKPLETLRVAGIGVGGKGDGDIRQAG